MIERLTQLIQNLGVTQAKFARMIGIDASTICAILAKRRNLSSGMIARIVANCGVSEQWLRTGEGEMFASVAAENRLTPEAFARSVGCGDLTAQIFARFCELPPDSKATFEAILDGVLAKRAESNRELIERREEQSGPRKEIRLQNARVGGDVNARIE